MSLFDERTTAHNDHTGMADIRHSIRQVAVVKVPIWRSAEVVDDAAKTLSRFLTGVVRGVHRARDVPPAARMVLLLVTWQTQALSKKWSLRGSNENPSSREGERQSEEKTESVHITSVVW